MICLGRCSRFCAFLSGEAQREEGEMGVCLYMWHGRARLPPCLLTSLSCAGVTDTLIIQFNSGWQLLLALRLWLCQSFAPVPHLFLPCEQEHNP